MSMNFNSNSEKTRFIFKPNPVDAKSFDIFENRRGYDDYTPAGSYVALAEEARELTEKRLVNLVGLLNGKGITVDLSAQSSEQMLFQVLDKKLDSDPTKIIFRTRDPDGVSVENAIVTLRRGVVYA